MTSLAGVGNGVISAGSAAEEANKKRKLELPQVDFSANDDKNANGVEEKPMGMSSSGNMTPYSSTKKHALNQQKAKLGAAASTLTEGGVKEGGGASVKADPDNPAFDTKKDFELRKTNLERVYGKESKGEQPPPLKDLPRLPYLPQVEIEGLGRMLQLESKPDGTCNWPEDWSGNLTLFFKEIEVKSVQGRNVYVPFATHYRKDWRTLIKFFAYVMTLKDIPEMAQRILIYSAVKESETAIQKHGFMTEAVQRTLYDKDVLVEDKWLIEPTIVPTDEEDEDEEGNVRRGKDSLGTHFIGRSVWWERSEAIVLAFVRDSDIGDLWKIKWIDETDTCDLEHAELMKGLKAWDRKCAKKMDNSRGSKRGATTYGDGTSYPYKKNKSRNGDPEYIVDGCMGGIVLATSFNHNARNDVLWPARIMHDDEVKNINSGKKMKGNTVNVVFFSPYWTSSGARGGGSRGGGYVISPAIFEMEVVDANKKMIQSYPFDGSSDELDIEELRMSFSLTGLPINNFKFYVDAHRLAMGFKKYGSTHNTEGSSASLEVAELRDCHIMSLKTPNFPSGLLELPWSYILQNLSDPSGTSVESATKSLPKEPILDLERLLATLKAPLLGSVVMASKAGQSSSSSSSSKGGAAAAPPSKPKPLPPRVGEIEVGERIVFPDMFFTGDILSVLKAGKAANIERELKSLGNDIDDLLVLCSNLISMKFSKSAHTLSLEESMAQMLRLVTSVILLKGRGEDIIRNSEKFAETFEATAFDWRRGMEDLFGYVRRCYSDASCGVGIGVTNVLTDRRCRGHLTSSGSMERSVRLPAALRGAKNAGAGAKPTFKIHENVEDEWVDLAVDKILPMIHEKRYVQRLTQKIRDIADDMERGIPLTDDSDGRGGEDTGGSKGSYDAAVSGVACALKAVNMVCSGESVNVFCATRPPGHHAGTNLRAFKASSNGFCLLNSAAAAAKYAVLSKDEGGLGLKRVCVIDFDVHHGNGTQDILCKTFDPRFLYVSMHAGNIKGGDDGSSDDEDDGTVGRTKSDDEIFPGKCGNTSPHAGVLNIPMGNKVTPSEVGQALQGTINTAVAKFSPDLIILSAGFDAHKHDPLGLGGLSAKDFGSITDLCCRMAEFYCSGRVVSILEGGYGVPCCKFTTKHNDLFLPPSYKDAGAGGSKPMAETKFHGAITASTLSPDSKVVTVSEQTRAKIGWLDEDDVKALDDMPMSQIKNLLKCAQEGFLDCVQFHCKSLHLGAERFKS
mmetsp:Transcript_7604/g.15292  ORF Transcript_7604/g.15292 Transcript_7604/m.15292 type:complete len:1242 (+) Transcript_7604:218-3943(+)